MTSKETPSLEDLKQFALDVIKRAGEEALNYYGKGRSRVKFDENLVTEAELHLKDYFQDNLISRFPDHHIFNKDFVGNEYSHEGGRYLWIFDPIDGVDNFQAGIPIWGMSLALLENFWPIMGVFYMPATEDLFHAQAGAEAYWDNEPIRVNTKEDVDNESLLLIFSRFHQHYQSKFPGKIRNLGCTAAHICYVAMGRADAAVIANESYQDLAATRVIIESAGGRISRMDGTGFHLNEFLDGGRIAEHLMVASPENYGEVLNYLMKG
jgi:myo-inositol-1(or 4)-monophosphatase